MTSSKAKVCVILFTLLAIGMAIASFAQAPPVQAPSSDKNIEEALTGGVPLGRWKEGLLFEGISPQPWLTSAANWFPRSEDVQPNEMRIIFMGTSPMVPGWQ
jgi:ribonuclease Z